MRGCLFVLVSASLRDAPEHTNPDSKPEPLEGEGQWVWVPASNVQQSSHSGPSESTIAAENAAAEEAEKAQEAEDEKTDERNRKIWAMKDDVMKLKMVMTNLQQAYDAANNVAGEVTENMNDWGTLESSLLQTDPSDESKDQLALDESFDGLHELTDRVEKANEILKTQMDKIPDTIIAPSAMHLVKSPEDLLKGPSSFLQEPDENAKEMMSDVREKKWEKKAEEKLKETFAGLEERKAELKKRSASLTQSLDHLEGLTEERVETAPAPVAGSLVEAARGGHWEWRAYGTKHAAKHHAQHHAQHRTQHRRQHHTKAKQHAKRDLPVEMSDQAEMQALDEAMAPLAKITQSVKDENAEMAEKLSELAQSVEVTSGAQMRRD